MALKKYQSVPKYVSMCNVVDQHSLEGTSSSYGVKTEGFKLQLNLTRETYIIITGLADEIPIDYLLNTKV